LANFPGAIEEALAVVPKSAGKYLRRAKEAVSQYLPASAEAARQALRVSG
jgi:hypothetical protein